MVGSSNTALNTVTEIVTILILVIQTMALAIPSDLMGAVAAYVHDTDEESVHIRRTCARHIILSFVLAYRKVSSRLQRLFPTLDKFVEAGLTTEEEVRVLRRAFPETQFEIPFQWIQENVRAKAGNHYAILASMNNHRAQFGALTRYNTYNVPLVYTQTVTIAVYGYFTFCLIGHQFYLAETDTWIPFLTILRFLFGVGWLKVAEDLAKPFGDDDDDTNMCSVIQSYIKMVFTIADYVPSTRPKQFTEGKVDEHGVERILSLFDQETAVKIRNGNKMVDELSAFFACKD